jgi:hypothetical chaperone protein
MFVGIDFGTSNSSIGVFQDNKLKMFNLDPTNANPGVLPSFTYINRDQEVSTGIKAVDMYLEQETGRRPIWEKRYSGAVEMIAAGSEDDPIMYMQDIITEVDVAANGRLIQSIKTGLRDPKYLGTQIFDRFYTIEELIAILLTRLRVSCEESMGQPVTRAVMGRPVKFAEDPAVDELAQKKLLKAAHMAGLNDVVFEYEPIGGAYMYHQSQPERQNILVFDFGGGTLDMTVVEVGGSIPPRTIATHGVLLGGDDLTAALMKKLFHYFGENSILSDGLPLPAYFFELLYNWQDMVELSRPKYAGIFKQAKEGSDPIGARRLEALVTQKLGFKLFRELEKSKITLSSSLFTTLHFFEDDLAFRQTILRTHFEYCIRKELITVEKAIDEIMRKSSLQPDQVQAVLRTGGSSEVPVIIDLLAKKFGREKVKEINPFTTVVGGLAIKAKEISAN